MRVLHNPDISSSTNAQGLPPTAGQASFPSHDQQGIYMYPTQGHSADYGRQHASSGPRLTSVDPQQQHRRIDNQDTRDNYQTLDLPRSDSIQAEYFPQTLPLRGYPDQNTRLFQPSSQQRTGASGQQGWTSRSGIPAIYNYGHQTWGQQDTNEAAYQQQSSSQQQTYQAPPGLARTGYPQFEVPTPNPTPGIYTPRTPHDYSPLPTPIARPRAALYGEPGPSAVIASASHRRSSGKDEFDGPHQFLPKPDDAQVEVAESQLIPLTISLQAEEQDDILTKVNDCLSKCAFDFVAKYQFPIPIEADKRPVRVPSDREWTEWCHLLKRLATKRRIPMRVLWNGQIKQLVTVLENSLEMRHAAKHQSRPLKDDRNVLQLISAGLQVAKILKDPSSMGFLDELYIQTERTIRKRVGSE